MFAISFTLYTDLIQDTHASARANGPGVRGGGGQAPAVTRLGRIDRKRRLCDRSERPCVKTRTFVTDGQTVNTTSSVGPPAADAMLSPALLRVSARRLPLYTTQRAGVRRASSSAGPPSRHAQFYTEFAAGMIPVAILGSAVYMVRPTPSAAVHRHLQLNVVVLAGPADVAAIPRARAVPGGGAGTCAGVRGGGDCAQTAAADGGARRYRSECRLVRWEEIELVALVTDSDIVGIHPHGGRSVNHEPLTRVL